MYYKLWTENGQVIDSMEGLIDYCLEKETTDSLLFLVKFKSSEMYIEPEFSGLKNTYDLLNSH